ncbi:hypothetical protein HPB49_006167 [Dermacentor silvarum]|uniref:Uncharacterized protein n=1 Tax=Dermacentor silvarum TaxID=543639 RepID=A0ACB8CJF1_DERSI|nr:hypothetical protein HPB49_006167 [Dermacentor silvarum]
MKTLSNNKLPVVLAFQEPFNRAQLPGYVTCGLPYECMGRDVRVCTLVKRGMAYIEHELVRHEESDIDHVLVEFVPSSGRRRTGVFVFNVYSSPSQRNRTQTFNALFREAMTKAASNPLLICGDFNPPHTQWRYGADSPKALSERMAEQEQYSRMNNVEVRGVPCTQVYRHENWVSINGG